MINISLTRSEQRKAMEEWESGHPQLPFCRDNISDLRNDIVNIYDMTRNSTPSNRRNDDYYKDSHFAVALYDYFLQQKLSLRRASDPGFWSFIALMVIPDVVGNRWGNDNELYFYKRATRIWPSRLWWYVHLSWQGSLAETQKLLEFKHFSMDTIGNLVERCGRKGTLIDVYRNIMLFYTHIPETTFKKFESQGKDRQHDIFRTVMKVNTARIMVVEPDLYLGGAREYARSLYEDIGITIR